MVEKEGHAGRVAIPLSNDHPELGTRREAIPDQVVFRRSNRAGFPFILRQLVNERQNQWDVFDNCLANFQHRLQALILDESTLTLSRANSPFTIVGMVWA